MADPPPESPSPPSSPSPSVQSPTPRRLLTSPTLSLQSAPRLSRSEASSGFRTVSLNDRATNLRARFASNRLRSAKYTPLDLIPKALLEQFRRFSNFYFLIVAVVSFIPNVSPYSPWASVSPLFVVVGFGFARDVYEDIQRALEDQRQNSEQHILLKPSYTQQQQQADSSSKTKAKTSINGKLPGHVQNELIACRLEPSLHTSIPSRDITVGDIVLVRKGTVFPCDLVLLHAAGNDDVAYVSTANLDGESSLKRIIVAKPPSGADFSSSTGLSSFRGTIRAQKPVPALHEFSGTMLSQSHNTNITDDGDTENDAPKAVPLSADNLLLRGSILRNTDYIYGAVVYTGRDTKVAINMRKPVSKLGTIERMLNRVVLVLAICLFVLIITSSAVAGIIQSRYGSDQWYMGELKFFSGSSTTVRGLGTFLILFSTFIPSSLFVTLEFVRVVQALFIVADVRMRSKRQTVVARSMNLNETLGEVEHILTDKTGTLTENDMRFVACSAGDSIYNIQQEKGAIDNAVSNNIQPVRDLLLGMAICHSVVVESTTGEGEEGENQGKKLRLRRRKDKKKKTSKESSTLTDEIVLNRPTTTTTNEDDQSEKKREDTEFSHADVDDLDDENGIHSTDSNFLPAYQGQSPDEVALVTSARTYGVALVKRTVESMDISHFGVDETYKILAEFEFSSDRKRMSMIVRCPDGRIRLFCKGADSTMLKLVKPSTKIELVQHHINEFAKMGLRTLVYAMRDISDEDFDAWFPRYHAAQNLIDGREEETALLSAEFEQDLTYVATTAVEDKLQDMVPETIKYMREAGVKLWVLTGDKRETAENVGYSANLLDGNMSVVHIEGESSKAIQAQLSDTLDEHGGVGRLLSGQRRRSSLEEFARKLSTKGSGLMFKQSSTKTNNAIEQEELGIIIDGVSLQFAMEDHPKLFMEVAHLCKVVICCRVTPLQKALAVRLVRTERNIVTLAIGDGGNDVSMIQEAHIGVGVFGKEGTQAARSADYAIGEFKHLFRLIVMHGRFSGVRTAGLINLSFYKNVFFTMTQVFFQFFAFATGQSFHDQWITAAFNVIITAASPFIFGIFERDLSESTVARFPGVYSAGREKKRLSLKTIAEYTLVYGMWHSLIVFFGVFFLFGYLRIVYTDGKDAGLFLVGLCASSLATIMTLLKFLIHSYTWNWVVLLGVILSFIVFIALIPVSVSLLSNYPMEGQLTMLASSPTFYLCLCVIITAGFFIDFLILLFRRVFRPTLIDRLQEWEHQTENRQYLSDK